MYSRFHNIVLFVLVTSVLILTSCEDRKQLARDHIVTGLQLSEKSDFDGALIEFTKAVKNDPDNAEAWYHRGNTHYNLHEIDKAISDLSKAIEVNPEHADAYANRGNARVYNGDSEGGCEDWKKAKELGKMYLDHKIRFCK